MISNPIDLLFALIQFVVALILIFRISWLPDTLIALLAVGLILSGIVDIFT